MRTNIAESCGMYPCSECGKSYTHKRDLNRHVAASHQKRVFVFSACGKSFTRNYSLTNHQKEACSRKRLPTTSADDQAISVEKRARVDREVAQEDGVSHLFRFHISDYDTDVRETINLNQQWILPFAKTNRKLMDTYNIPLAGYDTDRIVSLLEHIYRSQRNSYKVQLYLSVLYDITLF